MNDLPACDLHIHSNRSDGSYPPARLVRAAAGAGLSAVSITDHDTVEGQEEAIAEGERLGIEVVTGVELSIFENGRQVHVLGYLIDPRNGELRRELAALRERREERAREIVDRLAGAGLAVSYEEVSRLAGEGAVGRPHIAKHLLDLGYVAYFQEAFNRWLGTGKPGYVPKSVLEGERIMELLRGAGGVAVWAHPGDGVRNRALLDRMIGYGIVGIEAWHPNHDERATRAVTRMAGERGLVCTGGSDFHCEEAMQAAIGEIRVPLASLRELEARAVPR